MKPTCAGHAISSRTCRNSRTAAAYLNFAGFQEEEDAMMQAAFGPHYERLADLKTRYDPTNFFRLNQNIRPRSMKSAASSEGRSRGRDEAPAAL